LIAWQFADKVNTSEQALGASTLPNGLAYYNERLANQTTINLTTFEIHNIGLKNVARLRTEMQAVQTEFGFQSTLQFFLFERPKMINAYITLIQT
jgi:uncharacterized protein (DUF885 family)